MKRRATPKFERDQVQDVIAWFEESRAELPESVQAFVAMHLRYLASGKDRGKQLDAVYQELRRALGITPSSEKRPSGSPLAGLPRQTGKQETQSPRERIVERIARSKTLGSWHDDLNTKHNDEARRLETKLAQMPEEERMDEAHSDSTETRRIEDIELTPEQKARVEENTRKWVEHLTEGDGEDPAFKSVNETLMPEGSVLANEEHASLAVEIEDEASDVTVVKTLSETRVRYDFAMSVTRIELDVEKKVVIDKNGERRVLTASTREYGPPHYAVTWSALATLAVMVGQFAMPLNRLGTMLSTAGKRFTAGSLSRMLHYVAERLLPIYLHLANELAQCRVLAGDDTSCRVLEVTRYFDRSRGPGDDSPPKQHPPWEDFKTPSVAEASMRRCLEEQKARERRRENGDREATRTESETPSIGMRIGRLLCFESPKRNGDGTKQSLNTTVVSGRSVADDPRSLIVFYRSHLGGCGNLFEALLRLRDKKLRDVTFQGDLGSANSVAAPELLARFKTHVIGCSAHARRPFANYEHEDPQLCAYMLHLFLGLAMHEQRLDVHGRNRKNVLAVRQNESRRLWNQALSLAKLMTMKWSKETKLGAAARYIINHFDKLTAYLDDPFLEPTNNLRERMLRMEKLIEGSSMFRKSLEGRFVLDVVRTVLQTAVAAGLPVHEYVVAVLRANPEDIAKRPERYTPRAWANARKKSA